MQKNVFFTLVVFLLSACGGQNTPAIVETPTKAEIYPTQSPVPAKVYDTSFSLGTLNTVPPGDVIEELTFYGHPGGGGFHCSDPGIKQGIYVVNTSIEIMETIDFGVCHPEAKSIQIKVTRPDGTVEESTQKPMLTNGKGLAQSELTYQPDLTAPRGKYRFSFSGAGWELTQIIEVIDPDSGRMYMPVDQNQVILYGFKPGEKVRLFLYKKIPVELYRLQGWKEFMMDSSGRLVVSLDTKDFSSYYAAVGELSGQASEPKGFGGPGSFWDSLDRRGDIYCGNQVKPVGIHPGNYVQVNTQTQMAQSMKTPLIFLGTLKAGDLLKISEGPVCLDGSFWWYADCQNRTCELSGYVREIEGATQVLKIITALPPTPTFDPANIPACPDAKPTRLKPNSQAKVSKVATQLTMRGRAGMNAPKVHVIASGRLMNILADAPVCADNAYWWHVYVPEKGFEGWVREGDSSDYWIDPLP